MQKALTWDDVANGYDPEANAVEQPKGIGTKAYERFWGTDVDEDPMELIRLGGQFTGGLGGAIGGGKLGAAIGTAVSPGVGTAVGGGIGAMLGGFAGGMAGTVAPEAAMEYAEFFGVAKPGTRERLGLSDKELDTVLEGEMILDMMTAGGLSAARASVRGATKMFAGLGILPGRGRAAKDMAEFAAEHGVNMLPVQLGKREVPRGFVSVLGKFPLVAGPIKRNIAKAEGEVREAFEKLPASIAPVATNGDVTHSVFMDLQNMVRKTATEMDRHYKDIYVRADASGARVTPQETAGRISTVLADITRETPRAVGFQKKASHTAAMEDLKKFLRDDLGKIFKAKGKSSGPPTTAHQTFEQMSVVLDKIDEKLGKFGSTEAGTEAMDKLQSIRQAAQIDIYTNVTGGSAKDIASDLRALDRQYTETITDLFEVGVKKDFVPKGAQIDRITDAVMKGTDVRELEEVHRVVSKPVFQKMAAYSVNKKVWDVYDNGGKSMDMTELKRTFGFDNPKGDTYQHTKKLLELAGGINMEDLGKLIEVGQTIGKVEAPNASMFIARRGVMSGAEGIYRGLLPTIAGGAAGGTSGAVMATIAFMGGSHMVGRMITDPRIARPLRKVLDKEVGSLVRKGAALQIGRIFANEMISDKEFSVNEGFQWLRNYEKTIGGLYRAVKGESK